MATNAETVRDLYNRSMRELNDVVQSGDDAEVRTALQTLEDLTAMMLAFEIVSVRGRTALLSGLIVELTQVIESIDIESPIANALTKLGGIVDHARTVLTEEKKALLVPS